MRERIDHWLDACPLEERPAEFDAILGKWGAEQVIPDLLRRGGAKIGVIARSILGAKCLAATRHSVKTIGLFVGRIRGGGAERVVSLLARIFVDSGKTVVLFTQEPANPLDYPLPVGIERVVLPVAASKWGMRVALIRSKLSELKVDVYIHNAEKTPLLLYDVIAVKSAGVFFISSNHGCFAGHFTENSPLVESSMDVQRVCDATTVLSHDFEYCYRALGINARTVSNPMTLTVSETPKEPPVKETIVWIARRNPIKNYAAPLRILSEVVKLRPGVVLEMVGEPQDSNCDKDLLEMARHRKLLRNFKLLPYTNDVESLYGRASLLLLTSICEASPMVLPEAMARGVPIVMYNLPYVECTRDCEFVETVAHGDASGAASAICNLLDNPDKWKQASAQGKARAKELAAVNVGSQWDAVFNELLHEAPSEEKSAPPAWFSRELRRVLGAQRAGAETWKEERARYLAKTDPFLIRPADPAGGGFFKPLCRVLNVLSWRLMQLADFAERRFAGPAAVAQSGAQRGGAQS